MANTVTLTNLAPEIYKAMDIVAREQVGIIPGVLLNVANADGVNQGAFGDKVKSMRTASTTPTNTFTPAMTISAATDKSATFDEFALDQVAKDDLPLVGETIRRLNSAGGMGEQFRVDTFAQMIRGIVNQMESYLGGIIYKKASRATGTAGTTPFATNLDVLADLIKIEKDNGAPQDGQWSLVVDTLAGSKFRKLTGLQKVNEVGTADLLKNGSLLSLFGHNIRESAGIALHTKGTATGLDANGAKVVGDTTVALDGGDGGTLLAGDVVTFVGDTNKYVVNTGFTAAAGNMVLNRPGLRATLADTVEMTIGDNYTANLAFHRSAVEFAVRAADMGQDAAVEVLRVTDPITRIPFEFRRYAGEGMSKIMVVVYYGGMVWKQEFVAIALG